MKNNLFKKLKKNDSILRKSEIDSIFDFFKQSFLNNKTIRPHVKIIAEGGLGKSFLCRNLIDEAGNFRVLPIIDFRISRFISVASVLDHIVKYTNNFFPNSKAKLEIYHNAIGLAKVKYLQEAIESFYCEIDTQSQVVPYILIFDTLEAMNSYSSSNQLIDFINNLPNSVGLVLSGRNCDNFSNIKSSREFTVNLTNFSFTDMKKYISYRTKNEKIHFTVNNNSLMHIYNLSKQGKPLLCAFILDMLREDKNLSKKLFTTYMVDNKNWFLDELIESVVSIKSDELAIIKLLTVFNKKINSEIICRLYHWDTTKACNVLKSIERFSFVKKDVTNNYIIHDDIQQFFKRSPMINILPQKHELYCELLAYYDDLIISNVRDKWPLVDKFTYLYSEEGMTFQNLIMFDRYFMICVNEYNYEACSSLLDILKSGDLHQNQIIEILIQLYEAEILLQKYRPMEALSICDTYLKTATITSPTEEFIFNRASELKVICYVNPSTTINPPQKELIYPKVEDLLASIDKLLADNRITYFAVIDTLQKTFAYYELNRISHRLASICLFIGKCYQIIGQHNSADDWYNRALEFSEDGYFRAQIYEEKSNMYRLQQDLNAALDALNESLNEVNNIKFANYYYNLANIYRDKNLPHEARAAYNQALTMFKEIDDIFKESEVYGDWAWLEYLDDNLVDYQDYLEAYWNICYDKKYMFAISFSEYYHMQYHLLSAQSKADEAYSNLDMAISSAIHYQNIYILLDCLNHKAEQIFAMTYTDDLKINQISGIINAMLQFERTGCGFRAFVGRAMITLAKVFFKSKNLNLALENWTEGFERVAKYGDSGTNAEVFVDLFDENKDEYKRLLIQLDKLSEIKDRWVNSHVTLLVNEVQFLEVPEG